MSKSYKPKIEQNTGRIGDTQYVDSWKIKIGARVMLIFNIDISDLLCNGATGTVVGIEECQKGNVRTVIVQFDNPAAGKESQQRNPMMSKKYPGGTMIKKTERDYSLAKTKGLVSTTAKLIQFPLVLAWAVTVHKFQGQTVKKPQKVVIDLRTIFEAAQAYVMLSRVQEIEQLFILEEVVPEKIYANHAALEEIERLVNVSKNKNPTSWDEDDKSKIRISFLNCRSMKNKFENIKEDQNLLQSDLIILNETWLDEEHESDYILQDFTANFNSGGRGKGITTYFNEKFRHKIDIKKDGVSVTMMRSEGLDIIGVYRSQGGDMRDLVKILETLIDETRTTIVGGDFNVCVFKAPNNFVTHMLKGKGFLQIVKNATHIEGGVLDHVYIKQDGCKFSWNVEEFPKYYSDHDGLGLTLWTENKDKGKNH